MTKSFIANSYPKRMETRVKELNQFQSLNTYLLRKIIQVEMTDKMNTEQLVQFMKNIEFIKKKLGEHYLEGVSENLSKKNRSDNCF